MAFTGNVTCNVFKTALLNGTADFGSGVYKIALYTNNATLDANTTEYTIIGEVITPGYTAGGEILTPVVASSGGISFVDFGDVTWNAAITARGALIYKDSGPAVCVLDFGVDRTSTTSFTVQFPPPIADSAIIRLS